VAAPNEIPVRLKKLSLYNYRNYAETRLEFTADVIALLGKNGSGKTNLLDAIHYLSLTKSFLNATDSNNIKTGESVFSIKGTFEKKGASNEVFCSFQAGSKKIVREDSNDYPKLSAHIGKYPVVLIAPNDIELIWDGSEVRRKFVDGLLSQINSAYLEQLIVYTNYLKMRNAALKQFAERGKVDHMLLETYNAKLETSGDFIFKTRQEFMQLLSPSLMANYQFLADTDAENPGLEYKSDLEGSSMQKLLTDNLQRDLVMQRTTTGIHRDDFGFQLNGQELKRYGSQGQQKSFLIGLKLAEFEIISQQKGFQPIILLDDIFDKLDDDRIGKLIQLVTENKFGQIFITDARPERAEELLSLIDLKRQTFIVEDGILTEV
jgi:DNA replication and repair protein RecF